MDPLSVSASVAGLITTADIIVRRIYDYVKAARHAEEEVEALAREITSLYGILNSLHLVTCRFEGECFDTTLRVHHIHSCHETLESIKLLLDKDDPSQATRSIDRMKRRLRWPATATKTKALIIDVERHKTTLNLALNADSAQALLQGLSKQGEIANGVEEIKARLDRVVLNQERIRILDFLASLDPKKSQDGALDPKSSQDAALHLRQPGTGIWFLERKDFQIWLSSRKSKLWLNGIPGAGKTILTATIIQEIEKQLSKDQALAYWFCDYRNEQTQDVKIILGSLAKQFALQSEQCFEDLEAFYKRHNPDGKPTIAWNEADICELLRSMISGFEDVFLIIDALDECGKDRTSVIELLQSLNGDEIDNVKSLYTSRDEHDIRVLFQDHAEICVAAESADLRLYVAAEIELRTRNRKLNIRDPSLKEIIMDRLIDGAEGMFRWVTCQMDHLCSLSNDRARRKALDQLPPDLPSTYERILQRVNASNEENRVMVRRCLSFVVCAKQPISIAALAQIIFLEVGDKQLHRDAFVDEDRISTNIDPTKNPDFGAYRLDPAKDGIELSKMCITYLSLDDFDTECVKGPLELEQRQAEYPFRVYAVRQWDAHIEEEEDEELNELLRGFFEASKSSQFLAWTLERMVDATEIETYGVPVVEHSNDITPLHWAALLAFPVLTKWLIAEKSDVNRRSKLFGSPLNCALRGEFGFHPEAIDKIDVGYVRWVPQRRNVVVNLLIEASADINVPYLHPASNISSSPFDTAVRTGNVEHIRLLLQAGAIFDKSALKYARDNVKAVSLEKWIGGVKDTNIRDSDKADFKNVAVRCNWETGNISRVEEMLDGPKDDPSTLGKPSGFHKGLLRSAARQGQVGLTTKLAAMLGKDLVDSFDRMQKLTALYLAALNGHVEVVRILVKYGADVNNQFSGSTPLHGAAAGEHVACFEALLELGANPELVDFNKQNVAYIAVTSPSLDILKILKRKVPDLRKLDTATGRAGWKLLHHATFYGTFDAVKYLLAEWDGVSASDRTKKNESCLQLAVRAGDLEKTMFFLENGQDVNEKAEQGGSAIFYAVNAPKACKDMVDLLINRGAEVNVQDDSLATPLTELMVEFGYSGNEDKYGAFERIWKENPNLELVDEKGSTALHNLCRNVPAYSAPWNEKVLKVLLEGGADVGLKDLEGKSSLYKLFESWEVVRAPSSPPNSPAPEDELGDRAETCVRMLHMMVDHIIEKKLPNELLKISVNGMRPASLCLAGLEEFPASNVEELCSKVVKIDPDVDSRDEYHLKRSPLEWSCFRGVSPALAKELVSLSKDFTTSNDEGDTPLHVACYFDINSLVNLILDHASNLGFVLNDTPNKKTGGTPLMKAAMGGSEASVELLLERGADINMKDKIGRNVIHYAVAGGHVKILHLFLDKSVQWNLFSRETMFGFQSADVLPVHVATYNRCIDVVEFLFDHGFVNDPNATIDRNITLLFMAVSRRIPSLVSYFLGKGVDVHRSETVQNWTPLHIAAKYGIAEIIPILLDAGANPAMRDKNGDTPGDLAFDGRFDDLAWTLREASAEKDAGAELANKQNDWNGRTQLHEAADGGEVGAIRRLLDIGANINSRDWDGTTPVMLAAEEGHLEALDLFRERGANFHARNVDGWNALCFALSQENLLAVPGLMELGLSWTDEITPGWTPLHIGIKDNSTLTEEMIMEHASVPDVRGEFFGSVLNVACRYASVKMVQWILKNMTGEQNIRFINFAGWLTKSPLCACAATGKSVAVTSLLDAGADIDLVGGQFGTPLTTACFMGRLEVIRILVTWGATLEAKVTVHGETFNALEATAQHPEAREWLQEYVDDNATLAKAGLSDDRKTPKKFQERFVRACSLGELECVKIYVKRGTVVTNPATIDGKEITPIEAAQSHNSVLEWLRDEESDLHAKEKKEITEGTKPGQPFEFRMTRTATARLETLREEDEVEDADGGQYEPSANEDDYEEEEEKEKRDGHEAKEPKEPKEAKRGDGAVTNGPKPKSKYQAGLTPSTPHPNINLPPPPHPGASSEGKRGTI